MGGTTGVPKGVMLSHSNLYVTALAAIAERGWEQDVVTLHVAPMFHLANAALINTVILRGATHAVVPSFTPQQVLESIERDRVTDMLLVPTMLQMLVDYPDFAHYDTSSLRKVVYGASPTGEPDFKGDEGASADGVLARLRNDGNLAHDHGAAFLLSPAGKPRSQYAAGCRSAGAHRTGTHRR